MVLWIDGSELDTGNVGAAIMWRDKSLKSLNRWRKSGVFMGKSEEILDAELWAIAIALEDAKRESRCNPNVPIKVFIDS